MLLNAIPYESDFNIQIAVCDVQEYPVHYHQDLEILFLLKGNALLKNSSTTVSLSQGDIYTIPPRSIHGIRGLGEDNAFAVIHVNDEYLESHFPDAVPHIYRTLLEDRQNPDLGWLREQLLQLIATYFQREEGYRDSCNSLIHRIIALINSRFILFSLGESKIPEFDRNDTRAVERMTRIFKYLIENLESSVSLSDLAKQEKLSTFYLSHLIKEHTGCSFRELVSFMRAERSEIALLEGEQKISRIAKSCGFSTSRYYEEAFLKWYHSTPEQHVATYRHMRLDVSNLPRMEFLSIDDILELVSQVAFHVISQNRLVSASTKEPITLHYRPSCQTIRSLDCRVTLTCTMEDLKLLRALSLEVLDTLRCGHIILYQKPDDDTEEIRRISNLILAKGITLTISQKNFVPQRHRYGNDTLAGPICMLLDHFFNGDGALTIPLRDQPVDEESICGGDGLYTPVGIHKPIYDVLFAMAASHRELKLRGSHYGLLTESPDDSAFLLIAFNYNEELLRLCQEETTTQATEEAIRNFREELNLRFRLDIPAGTYSIRRYTNTHHSGFFHLLSQLGFRDPQKGIWRACSTFLFSPHAEGRIVTAEDTLEVDITLRGLSIQFVQIERLD